MTAMIAHSTRPPLLGALVRQLMQLDARPSAQMTERRRQRIETMLALLLEHGDLSRLQFAKLLGLDPHTITNSARYLIDDGLASTWVTRGRSGGNTAEVRWYGLTHAGRAWAERLKEMSDDKD